MKVYIKSTIRDIGDEDKDVRKDIAKSTSDDPDVFERLAKDPDRKVREQVAKNPNTPPEILKRLSKDKSHFVYEAVASNPSTPSELLRKMADPKFFPFNREGFRPNVYPQLIKNPNTPINCRITICSMPYQAFDTKLSLAKNKNTPPEILEAIYNDGNHSFRSALAANPSTPTHILKQLYKSSWVSEELAKNPNTPTTILKKIFLDNINNERITSAILKNPNLDKQLKAQLKSQLTESQKASSLNTYVGKDIWIEAESYGISRDYDVYIRLVKKTSHKHEYVINEVYDKYEYLSGFGDTKEEYDAKVQLLLNDMNETSTQIVAKYDTPNVEEDIVVYRQFETYTTEELIKKFCGEYDED